MPAPKFGFFIPNKFSCRKDILPLPRLREWGVFASQGIGEGGVSFSSFYFRPVNALEPDDVSGQLTFDCFGKHRHAILKALAVAHQDLISLEINIFDPQVYAFG